MTTAPQINLRDGTGTTSDLVFTTNLAFITLTGTVDTNTVSVQVSINGGAFSSDSSLVELDGFDFTVPNPTSYPDGLTLDIGVNTIRIRSIDIVGSVSPIATATISRVESFLEEGFGIPSGIKVRRERDQVVLMVTKPVAAPTELTSTVEFRGFNFYASTSPGGTSGYFKINASPVTEDATEFEEDLFEYATGQVDFEMVGDQRVRLTQENVFGVEVADNLNTLIPAADASYPVRFAYTFSGVDKTEFVTFTHNRAGGDGITNSDQWTDVENAEPLYYVVAAVYYDPDISSANIAGSTQNVLKAEYETPYSQEVLGLPLVIDTTIRDLPGRTQLQIVINYVDAIQRVNEEVTLIPGSTTRDVSVDPFSSEAERIWFILDFVHRSQSFLTLLQIDDANGDNVSDPVISSAYKSALKSALGFSTDQATQQLIDTQFEKLAGNFQKTRLPGRGATGQVVFYSETRPTLDITIAAGTSVSGTSDDGTQQFTVGGTFILPAVDAEAYYNFETRRYEVIADILAANIGAAGNVPAGTITNVLSSSSGFSVTNTEATTFGSDRESNYELALRAQLAFSVDTGTEGGYASTAAEQNGIIKSNIVKSGDALMMRDYDEVRDKHIGGKVDVWVQGLKERTITETFAFTFEIVRDHTCLIVDVANLIFRVQDPRVTLDTPITEILDNATQGLGVRNASQGQDYDLTGVTIIDYQTFQIDVSIQTFTTAIDDVVNADFRFRSVNDFVLSYQPVRRVTSVVGQSSGALTTAGFDLYKTEDPLWEGESTIAQNYVQINQIGGIPTGDIIAVSDEQHVMIGFFEERLLSIGINTPTIRVYNEARTLEYNNPSTTAPDFEIIEGTATTPAKIIRTTASTIVSGETVSIDYEHDENFEVTYVINDLLQQLQATINRRRHTTADVLVKQAILNSVDLETTIQLKAGATKDTTDPKVRTSVSTELNSKTIGQGTAQSDMINAIDSTDGVDFQVLPLAKMGYAEGSQKMRETLISSSLRLGSLDVGGNRVYIFTNALQYPTVDEGGGSTVHKGVFQDDLAMTMVSDLTTVGQHVKGAYIIGATGVVIAGYSDDATITAETGLTDPDDIEAERLRRTANHVVVSLEGPTDEPSDHAYGISYTITGDRGPHDIQASEVEFIDLGELTLTFRSAE
jgi:Baseplate J-like protein